MKSRVDRFIKIVATAIGAIVAVLLGVDNF